MYEQPILMRREGEGRSALTLRRFFDGKFQLKHYRKLGLSASPTEACNLVCWIFGRPEWASSGLRVQNAERLL